MWKTFPEMKSSLQWRGFGGHCEHNACLCGQIRALMRGGLCERRGKVRGGGVVLRGSGADCKKRSTTREVEVGVEVCASIAKQFG